MPTQKPDLVPVFVPSLGANLLFAEDRKGAPLTPEEALAVRDRSTRVMMPGDTAKQVQASRGQAEIDPENCWHDFQELRRSLGRPPLAGQVDRAALFGDDPPMLRAVVEARRSLGQFRRLLHQAALSGATPMVKVLSIEGEARLLLWLNEAAQSGLGFRGRVFERPPGMASHRVGDRLEVSEDEVVDWLVHDDGTLHGGFSLRLHRSRLAEDERPRFDARICVNAWAPLP